MYDWLSRVFLEGESVQAEPPSQGRTTDASVLALLEEEYERHSLDIAGRPPTFDPGAAWWSARVLEQACWGLVSGEEPELPPSPEPDSPSAHLSGDVCLRLLPAVLSRLRLRSPDGLTAAVIHVLRRWPLSGVLADLEVGPVTELDLGGHPGLQLLYAERLARCNRPGWIPPDGPAREWVEQVDQELGLPIPSTRGTTVG